jgi:hypothetical protein
MSSLPTAEKVSAQYERSMRGTVPGFSEGALKLDNLGFCVGAPDTLECALILQGLGGLDL